MRASKNLVLLALAQNITELLKRRADELSLLPEVGGEETVGVDDGNEGGLEGVLEGLGGTGRGGVSILDTGELEQTLDGGGGDKAGTTGSGNELEQPLVKDRSQKPSDHRCYIHGRRRNHTFHSA